MVRINRKRVDGDRGDKDIKIDRNSIKANQFLEIATAKNVHIESVECGGMRILAKEIFLDGDIVSSGPVVLSAMEIHINRGGYHGLA
ncbi:MAG: hypothetical protein LBB12_03760 [Holosporaceae bacterium]|nr:hypothetical protein [Holosporaceae bacterium]